MTQISTPCSHANPVIGIVSANDSAKVLILTGGEFRKGRGVKAARGALTLEPVEHWPNYGFQTWVIYPYSAYNLESHACILHSNFWNLCKLSAWIRQIDVEEKEEHRNMKLTCTTLVDLVKLWIPRA